MADLKLLPPSASAEGETAALQAQVLEASTVNKENGTEAVVTPEDSKLVSKKASGAGLENYFVGALGIFSFVTMLANIATASLQIWNYARLLFNIYELPHINRIGRSK